LSSRSLLIELKRIKSLLLVGEGGDMNDKANIKEQTAKNTRLLFQDIAGVIRLAHQQEAIEQSWSVCALDRQIR